MVGRLDGCGDSAGIVLCVVGSLDLEGEADCWNAMMCLGFDIGFGCFARSQLALLETRLRLEGGGSGFVLLVRGGYVRIGWP